MNDTLLCYDSTNPQAIPADAPMVAGYVDGKYAWKPADWHRFSNRMVTIAVEGSPAYIGDVENGAMTIAQGARYEVFYGSKTTVGEALKAGVKSQFWIADPTGAPHILPACVGTQYYWGPHYDESLMLTSYWDPTSENGETMPNAPCVSGKLTASGKGYWLFGSDGGVFCYGDAGYWGSIPALGLPPLNKPIVAVDIAPKEDGYIMFGGDYGVFGFGSCSVTSELGHP